MQTTESWDEYMNNATLGIVTSFERTDRETATRYIRDVLECVAHAGGRRAAAAHFQASDKIYTKHMQLFLDDWGMADDAANEAKTPM